MTDTPEIDQRPPEPGHWLQNQLFRGVIASLSVLPYERRLAAMSWMSRRFIGPLAGYKARALKNLAMVYPEKSEAERQAIAERVLDSFGRSIMENYSRQEFRERIAKHEIHGPGLAAAQAAQEAGQPVIFSSGHYSNHEATRTALDLAGFKVGGLYKPMSNPYFNLHYVDSITEVSGPVFPLGKEGTKDFFHFLSNGGHGFLLHDVHYARGPKINFLGKPAKTALSAAELALKFDGLLIPYFNTRQPDGVSFKIELCAPIPTSDPLTMTKELVGLLEEKIATDPGQWLWIHRRWKGVPGAA